MPGAASTTVVCGARQQPVGHRSHGAVVSSLQCLGGHPAFTGALALEPSPVDSAAVLAPVFWEGQVKGTVESKQASDSLGGAAPAIGPVLEPQAAKAVAETPGSVDLAPPPPPL